MPYSGFCLGPAIVASFALSLSLVANVRCSFLDITNTTDSSLFPSRPSTIGLWCLRTVTGSNVDISGHVFDEKYSTARTLGTITCVLGIVIVVFFLFAICTKFPPKIFQGIGFLCILICLFQGLVFLIFQSAICTLGCTLGTGGKCAIAACVCWCLAAGLLCFIPATKKKPNDEDLSINSSTSRR